MEGGGASEELYIFQKRKEKDSILRKLKQSNLRLLRILKLEIKNKNFRKLKS